MLIRSVFVRFQSSRIPAFVCGPREARGQRLASLGVGGGGTSLRSDIAPRFARTDDLASLGQAELCKWLSSVGACVFLCYSNPWKDLREIPRGSEQLRESIWYNSVCVIAILVKQNGQIQILTENVSE